MLLWRCAHPLPVLLLLLLMLHVLLHLHLLVLWRRPHPLGRRSHSLPLLLVHLLLVVHPTSRAGLLLVVRSPSRR